MTNLPPLPDPCAWMTSESAYRLAGGGNGKGAVPVHQHRSPTANRPLFTQHQMQAYAATAVAAEREKTQRLQKALDFISTADSGMELFPCGPQEIKYADDGNTVIEYVGPWFCMNGKGDTFLDAVDDAMARALVEDIRARADQT